MNTLEYQKDQKIVSQFVWNGSNICLKDYESEHVIYAFIIPFDSKYVIVKFGYTCDIVGRYRSLMIECERPQIFLIGLKVVHNEGNYRIFLKALNRYEHQKENVITRDKRMADLYRLSKALMIEFNAIEETDIAHNEEHMLPTKDVAQNEIDSLKMRIEYLEEINKLLKENIKDLRKGAKNND